MDNDWNLVALGAFGHVTGTGEITSFRGSGGYWYEISDGFVVATVHLKKGESIDADPAWLIVGGPKYAPELVNITNLDDTMYNVAIRKMGADPDIYKQGSNTADAFARVVHLPSRMSGALHGSCQSGRSAHQVVRAFAEAHPQIPDQRIILGLQ